MFRRSRDQIVSTEPERAFDDFHDWVLSLPWVVERPYNLDTPGVRCFAVDCEPLGRRQLWLMTGLDGARRRSNPSLTVIVPRAAANEIEDAGWGRIVAPMPREHSLVAIDRSSFGCRREVEALVLTAYGYAMS